MTVRRRCGSDSSTMNGKFDPLADHFRKLNILQEINADVPPAVLSTQLCTLVRTAIGFNDKKLSVSSSAEPRERQKGDGQ